MGTDQIKIGILIILVVLLAVMLYLFTCTVLSTDVKTEPTFEPNLTSYVNKNVTQDEIRFMSYLSKATKNKTKTK